MLFPWENEVFSETYVYSLNRTIANACAKYPSVYYHDLRACYRATMTNKNLVSKNLWWIPEDGHHKPLGYAMMADCIYENVKPHVVNAITSQKKRTKVLIQ